MKKIIFLLFLAPAFCKAQTTAIPVDSVSKYIITLQNQVAALQKSIATIQANCNCTKTNFNAQQFSMTDTVIAGVAMKNISINNYVSISAAVTAANKAQADATTALQKLAALKATTISTTIIQ
jgi:hypothetical protein